MFACVVNQTLINIFSTTSPRGSEFNGSLLGPTKKTVVWCSPCELLTEKRECSWSCHQHFRLKFLALVYTFKGRTLSTSSLTHPRTPPPKKTPPAPHYSLLTFSCPFFLSLQLSIKTTTDHFTSPVFLL